MLALLPSSDVWDLGQLLDTLFLFSARQSSLILLDESTQRYLVSVSDGFPNPFDPRAPSSVLSQHFCCYSHLIVLKVICFYVKSTEFVELRD